MADLEMCYVACHPDKPGAYAMCYDTQDIVDIVADDATVHRVDRDTGIEMLRAYIKHRESQMPPYKPVGQVELF